MVGKRAPTTERFLAKFEIGNDVDCWLWTANKNGAGYGLIWHGEKKRKILAHRLSLEHFTAQAVRDDDLVLHSCDNPACVNPAHLRIGNHKQNAADMDARGRRVISPLKGESNPSSILNNEQVTALLNDYISGLPKKKIAYKYGISLLSVNDYTRGKSWKHLHGKNGCPTSAEIKAAKRVTPITESVVREVWHHHLSGKNVSEIVKITRQSVHSIEGIVYGKTWRHLDDAPSIERLKMGGVKRGYNQFSKGGETRDIHPCTKVPSSEIPSILLRIRNGETLEAIGKTYCVKKTAIWRIKKAHQ